VDDGSKKNTGRKGRKSCAKDVKNHFEKAGMTVNLLFHLLYFFSAPFAQLLRLLRPEVLS
jgi:hypothetical protein